MDEMLNLFAALNHYRSYAEMIKEAPETADIDPAAMREAIEEQLRGK